MADEFKKRTENVEFGIDELTPPEHVDYFTYRLETGRHLKHAKEWRTAWIVTFLALLVMVGWNIFLQTAYTTEEITIDAEQTTESGSNFALGGDYYGNSEGQNNNQEAGS